MKTSIVQMAAHNTSLCGIFLAVLSLAAISMPVSGAEKENAANAKAQVVVRTAGGPLGASFGGTAANVLEEVDPADATERVLLLTPAGPLVIQLDMTIDGQPFRTEREALVESMLKQADTDEDGQATWNEAFTTPKFLAGRLVNYARNEQARKQFTQTYDKNSDGKIDRYECRLLVAGQFAGAAFSMYNAPVSQTGGPDLFELLDADNDKVLSEKELLTASERLKSRDRDENDILDAAELSGAAAARGFARPLRVGAAAQPTKPLLGLIGKSLNLDEAYTALLARYGKDERLPTMHLTATPALARVLDKNDNGLVEKEELTMLNEIEPHLHLKIALGETGDEPAGLSLVSVSDDLGKAAKVETIDNGIALDLAGARLELISANVNYGNYDYSKTADAMITRYDADKNGYLEEKEFGEGQQAVYLKQQFATWDADSDGKVFAKEITAAYEQMTRPQNYRVSLAGADLGGSLFSAIDETGDYRLSLREMRTADERLKKFDEDKDGQITQEEVPSTLRVAVARGGYAYTLVANRGARYGGRQGGFVVNRGGAAPAPAKTAGPEWFARMDRNGDGDVTLKEFLGDAEQFNKLDANGDGFIERKEAEAVEPQP